MRCMCLLQRNIVDFFFPNIAEEFVFKNAKLKKKKFLIEQMSVPRGFHLPNYEKVLWTQTAESASSANPGGLSTLLAVVWVT